MFHVPKSICADEFWSVVPSVRSLGQGGKHRRRVILSSKQGVILLPELSLVIDKPPHSETETAILSQVRLAIKSALGSWGICYFCFVTGCVLYIVLVWFLACVCETEFAEKNKIVLVF